jgi:hypothetical protein
MRQNFYSFSFQLHYIPPPNTPDPLVPKIIIVSSPPLKFTESLFLPYHRTLRLVTPTIKPLSLFKHIERLNMNI